MNIIKSPLSFEEQAALKRFLREENFAKLLEEVSGREAGFLADAAALAVGANSATQDRVLPPKFWIAVQNAEKWGAFKKVLEEMTHESYSFHRFTVKTQ